MEKKIRNKIYAGVLEKNIRASIDSYPSGLCYSLLEFNGKLSFTSSDDAIDLFPEFSLFEPEEKPDKPLWFGNISCDDVEPDEVRHTVLMFCIEMTR